MKKITSKLTLLLMVLAMTFGLVACGGKEFSSISDYLNSDQVKTQLDSVKKQVEGSGMKIDVTAEGDKMVYTYTYEKLEKTDGMAEQLESALKQQDSRFQNTCEEIKKYVDVDTAYVVIKYVDSKGTEIYSKEYSSK